MRRLKRAARVSAFGCGGFLAALVLVLVGYLGYINVKEHFDPSGRVYIMRDGQREYLVQPTALVQPNDRALASRADQPAPARPPASPEPTPAGSATPRPSTSAVPTAPPTVATIPDTPLPPLRLQIPAIGVDVPVSLVTTDDVPHIPVAGWLFHTAFPATAGNTVFAGHLDGPGAIFGHLAQVHPGDQIRIWTGAAIVTYRVDTLEVVPETAVDVIAPTPDAVVTLITCSGDWDYASKRYHQRLVVRGHFVASEPRG
ncbi:MAG TPA: class F sortase [Thermomicrobiaceae bacterium]|nr:class F sortase [Thermomicrobiaceae bacterium]